MEEIIYPINLDLRTNTHKVLVMKEGDYNSRVIEATITDNGKPFNIDNCTVDIKWRKPDGHLVYSEATKINSYTLRVVCTEQMLCVSGISVAEIVITDSNSVVSTLTFNISVNETVASDFDIESSDEFSSLRQMKEHIANNSIHIPEGGTAGQTVIKDENGNVTWGEVSGGGSGDYLEKENPTGTGSFSMNRKAGSEIGDCSVAVGRNCEASKYCSYAEGNYTVSNGGYGAHAEGSVTTASGYSSHAEGEYSKSNGDYSHAEGKGTTTNGYASHAEGFYTTASGYSSHAEGYETTASGHSSHAEGSSTNSAIDVCGNISELTTDEIISKWKGGNEFSLANSQGSHVEGEDCLALEESSHAEGCKTIASGAHSHAEGAETWSNGLRSHTEGFGTKTDAPFAHAEGYNTVVNGQSGHAEGTSTIASGSNQHVQGKFNVEDTENKYAHIVGGGDYYNRKNIHTLDWEGNAEFAGSITGTGSFSMNRKAGTTVGDYSHAEGWDTTASGDYSHAEGRITKASEYCSHAEGVVTRASGYGSHAEGAETTASGNYSHAEGFGTSALTNQHAQGHYNDITLAKANSESGTSDGTAFVIGNGTYSSNSNAFRVTGKGVTYAKGAYNSTGADYAEFAEWADGNSNNEDRRGYFVTFDEEKPTMIRKANEGDYILGIVSGNPCIIGNADEGWLGKYIFDEFGSIVYEDVEVEETYTDEKGEKKTRTVKVNTYKINPDYDPTKEYVHREKRKEWDAIGWIGVLSVRDDGSCIAGGYCKVADGGIATKADRGFDTYRVIKRVTDNVIKIALK